MAQAARKDTSNSATVSQRSNLRLVPTGSQGTYPPFPQELPTNDPKAMKGILEDFIQGEYLKSILQTRSAVDDPFDAIYISRLTPDPVDRSAIARLQRFAKIVDLSDTLEFADDFED